MPANLLPAEKEEHEPQAIQPEQVPISESLPNAEAPAIVSAPIVPKKKSKISLAAAALGVCVFLLLVTFAWVGYWAYRLSTELTTAQQQLTVLQAEHDQLQAEYAALPGSGTS